MTAGRSPAARALGALAAALVTLLAGASAAHAAKPIYGVVPQDGALPSAEDLELMPSAGITSVRIMAHWGTAEQTPGTYNWKTLDAIVRETTNRGVQPMLFFYGIPNWAAEVDNRDCNGPGETICTVFPPRSDATRAAFAAFAKAAVRRYGPNGTFWRPTGALGEAETAGGLICDLLPALCPDGPIIPPPPPPPSPEPPPGEPPCGCTEPSPIRVWQVWNEQNSPKYFAPKVNVKIYAKLLREVGGAIHSVDPGADVMLGGMWGPNSAGRVVMPVSKYLKRLYRVKGIKRSFDSVALHPYSSTPRGSVAALRQARRLMNGRRDRRAGIWISELGWASGGPRKNPYVKGKRGQARLLKGALRRFESEHRRLKLRGIYWYSWRDLDGGDKICDWCGHAGLRKRDGSAKPAWRAFKQVARR